MTKTKGRNPIDINERVSVGGVVRADFDGIGLSLTFANPLSDEMSHICLSTSAFEEVVRFAEVAWAATSPRSSPGSRGSGDVGPGQGKHRPRFR